MNLSSNRVMNSVHLAPAESILMWKISNDETANTSYFMNKPLA